MPRVKRASGIIMHGPKIDSISSAAVSRNRLALCLVAIAAMAINLFSSQVASANGALAQPTPRPWGKFVPIKLSRQTIQRGKLACNYLRHHHRMHHLAAAAIIGHLIQESKVKPTGIRGDRGTAFGVAQWRGIRFEALKRFASKSGRTWQDLHAQLDFIVHELGSSEGLSGRALRSAGNIEEATAAFMHYERPQGYSYANPRAGNAWLKRLANAAFFVQHGYCWQHDRELTLAQVTGHH